MSFRFTTCISIASVAFVFLAAGCSEVRGRKKIQEANELYKRGRYQQAVAVFEEAEALVPLAIWIMRGFIVTIPEELEHAAMTDGATRVGAMFRVILPIAAPGLVATATLSFIAAWNEFMLALTFMNTEERKTLPLVLQSFVGRGDTDWGAVMATSVIYTLPVVIFFLLLRKRLMLGMTAGAVKG